MELKKIGPILLVLAAAFAGAYFVRPEVKVMVDKVVSETRFGAIPGDTLPDCVNQNGSEICRARVAMNNASSTVCSMRAPTHASSTATIFTANISTATSSVAVMVLQTATSSSSGFAPSIGAATTSRVIISRDYVASSQNLFAYYATGTPGTFQANELGPGEYLVFSLKSGTIADANTSGSISGACNATFQVTR